MNLRGLVSVSGKPGLFKLIGQNKSGFILETLDEQKNKVVVNMNTAKMASLEDITIFGEKDDLKLSDIFTRMIGKDVPDPKMTEGRALRDFFIEVAPEHDQERVYSSDIKKVINWFRTVSVLPLFTEETPAPLSENDTAHPIVETAAKKAEPVVREKSKAKATKSVGKSATRLSQKSK